MKLTRLLGTVAALSVTLWTSAFAQSTPDLIPGIGSAYPNRNMQGDTKWAPTVDQWDALTKYKLDFTSISISGLLGALPSCTPGSTVAPVATGQPFICGGVIMIAQ